MKRFFVEKKAKVAIVESSASVRGLMTEALKAEGVSDCSGVASLKDLLGVIEVEPVDVVISSFFLADELNLYKILKLSNVEKNLRQMRVIALCEESEHDLVLDAFQLGLLAWSPKSQMKDDFQAYIKELFKVAESAQYHETQISALYLTKILEKKKQISDALPVWQKVSNLFPGDPFSLLQLADIYFKSDKKDHALHILSQIKKIGPVADKLVSQFCGQHKIDVASIEKAPLPEGFENTLGLKDVILIDGDDTVQTSMRDSFKELGVENIHQFTEGKSAWKHISEQQEEPGLIVMEWRIKNLSAPILIQRIRSKGFHSTPIIILSSLVQPSDMPLVKEMSVANIILKPFMKELFLGALFSTLQEERNPKEQKGIERKIIQLIFADNLAEAKSLGASFVQSRDVPHWRKKHIEAELYFAEKRFTKAKEMAIEALKGDRDSVLIVNLLGKIFVKLRDFDSAIKCFEKAQLASPLNIERLCTMAETQAEMKNEEASKEAINKAENLDPDSERVQESQVNVAVVQGDINAAKSVMKQLNSSSNIIAFINNRAVSLASKNQFEEASKLYSDLLAVLPDDEPDVKGVVEYNYTLSIIKKGELADALKYLREAKHLATSRVKAKAQSLTLRLESSLKYNKPFELKASGEKLDFKEEQSVDGGSLADLELQLSSTIKVGEFCCLGIYVTSEFDQKISKYVKNLPKFSSREAIARAESFGTEKTHKAG